MAKNQGLLILVLVSVSLGGTVAIADDVHRAGIQETNILPTEQPYVPQYGAPKMVGPMMVPKHAMPPPHVQKPPPKPPLKAGVTKEVTKPPVKPPVQPPKIVAPPPVKEGVLPTQFLGRWNVMGSRSNIEAQPQFQKGIEGIFAATTSNMWNFQGSPEQGYMFSNDKGVSTPCLVATQGDKAIIKYQEPINKTMAQEAIVMQLVPGGVEFEGLERITIVKQGEPPRAKVTYKLIGHRQ